MPNAITGWEDQIESQIAGTIGCIRQRGPMVDVNMAIARVMEDAAVDTISVGGGMITDAARAICFRASEEHRTPPNHIAITTSFIEAECTACDGYSEGKNIGSRAQEVGIGVFWYQTDSAAHTRR
ncbi:hypothetical protein M409DRAFT_30561 [Zasmidium cellare ATCC 36951]|uniref:Uncharacterized protein n=1 Tax=Zasmidium cellare ATCC 36951 TaxID=1080233 RepID=A0A6A6C005_ZASCE|nr:uncharacterized protein M409DRAFT_30561 [Zasmidium cellare ATCC 36951]KAF2159026.1 hypothetical protein M409DRAFT_30561 [Zasmidium cellare ATCC 36951]